MNHVSHHQDNGSRRKRPHRASLNIPELIDHWLSQRVKITIGGKPRYVTCLEAILLQLNEKANAPRGGVRARRTLMQYIGFFATQGKADTVELVFTPEDEDET